MEYKIKELVEQGYDFLALFPEKQESVRRTTGLDFDLESVVKFLQRQTNNFTIDNQVAHDLDDAIYALIVKAFGKEKPPAELKPTPISELEKMMNDNPALVGEFESLIEVLFPLNTDSEKDEIINDLEIEMYALELLKDDDEESKVRYTLIRDMVIPKLKELK